MAALLITYDLNRPGQNYSDLHEVIKELGAWWHYLDSTWIVDCDLTPSQAWDRLKPKVDSTDNVLVIDISRDIYSGWLPQDAWDWLRAHVGA